MAPQMSRSTWSRIILGKSLKNTASSPLTGMPQLSTGEDNNPLVLATFHGAQSQRKLPRILVYGHYDVIDAPVSGWSSDPFQLLPLNGYLYGRGITDNKGPVMAIACAAASLLSKRALDLDLVMLIEGEEEAGSRGFSETVKRYKDQIGDIDAILVRFVVGILVIRQHRSSILHTAIQRGSARQRLASPMVFEG